MEIKEITADEFKKFNDRFNTHSIYQTPEYGFVMHNQGFESLFLGMIKNNDLVGVSLILIEKRNKFKYAYAPRGFLINYNDFNLLEEATSCLKKYLGKLGVVAVKLSPLIIKNIHDIKYGVIDKNHYYDNVFNILNKLGYYHYGYNNYFEALKPRFEAIIDLDLPYYMLFNNIKKEFKTKIRSSETRGVKVYKGGLKDLEYLYLQTKRKYPRDLEYFKDCYKYFKKDNKVEFYYTKLDTNKYLKYITKKYHNQELICQKYIRLIGKDKSDKVLTEKIVNDQLLESYKKELIKATNYLTNNPDGIVTSSILTIKNNDEVYVLMDGYDNKFKYLNSKHLLIWKLIEKYSNEGFKKFNLGGMTNPDVENNEYHGLNEFKLGFDSKCIEYIGDLELVCNNALYFMYKNSFSIKDILKK